MVKSSTNNKQQFNIIIPARYASTRFPGKPLVLIQGKTMIARVYRQAQQVARVGEVWVATDDVRIFDHVEGFGGKAIMTSDQHQSGTDRCAEVAQKLGLEGVVINVQGDEPFIEPAMIEQLMGVLERSEETHLATLYKKITQTEDVFNPNVVKMVKSKNTLLGIEKALYFSRNPIPFYRGLPQQEWLSQHPYYKHIGLYGYRVEALHAITKIAPSALELAESLEQLRWLEQGYTIGVAETNFESIGIDTPEQLKVLQGFPFA
jgi:3-deoxy-manno-octulosonate cytidylyltransferase (CMP-KDO synthetase)